MKPFTPPDLDLRDFPYMPLDVVRLVDSDLTAIATGDEFKAAVLLWCKSWHQVPAASLPDDDRMLAHLAGFGRDIKEWKKVREIALRGFVKCDDGRLYHPVIAEKANDAADAKRKQREKTANATAARKRKSGNRDDNRDDGNNGERDDDRNEQRDVKRDDDRDEVQGKREGKEREREKKEQGQSSARATPSRHLFEQVEKALAAIPELAGHPVKTDLIIDPIVQLVDQGYDLATQIVPSIAHHATKAKKPLRRWSYFVDGIIDDCALTTTHTNGAHAHERPRTHRRQTPGEAMREAIDDLQQRAAGRHQP